MRKSNKNQSGVALLMVIIAVGILAIITAELGYMIGVDRQLGRNLSSGLRAYYLSKSAARFSLWRLRAYMAAQKTYDENPNNGFFTQDDVDKIWSLPLPALPFDSGNLNISAVDKSNIDKFKQKTTTVGNFFSQISAEGKKININLLTGDKDWGSDEKIQAQIRKMIVTILDQDYYSDEDFQEAYPDFNAEDSVDAIIDYIDRNEENRENQPDENSHYEQQEPPYTSKNLPLYTLEELRKVRLWNDAYFDRWADKFTVFPSNFYINVAQADSEMFDAMVRMEESEPNEEDLSEFLTSRGEEPFKDIEDFKKRFEAAFGVKPPEELRYSVKDRTFIIKAFGESGSITRKQVLAVRMESKPTRIVNCDNKKNKKDQEKCEQEQAKKENNPPLDFMRVVYWREEQI